jgi:multiple sugar transport system ATP-binding protein
MARVALENVSKLYPGNVQAVDNLMLEVRDGEFVVLVGPSGCGKSTTLRMIAGLEEVTSGTVTIGDRMVNDVQPKDRDIAMVFQNYALYPHMTVRQNMAFALKLRKVGRDETESRIQAATEMLGLGELLDRLPKALSGGQRQRVAVGRAIVRQPAAFLFDEPLSNLDAKLRVQMRLEIARLHNRLGTTMIYVTHDQAEAMTLGDRIVVMNDGVVRQIAAPTELYDRPADMFVAGFIGVPQMNFFAGTIETSAGDVSFRADAGFELPVSADMTGQLAAYVGKAVTLGLRPEHIGAPESEQGGGPRIPAVVDVVEAMGSESFVHLHTGDTSFVSRVDAHRRFDSGQECLQAVFMEKAHFFDTETQQRIE